MAAELWTFWGHMKQIYGQIYYTTHLFQRVIMQNGANQHNISVLLHQNVFKNAIWKWPTAIVDVQRPKIHINQHQKGAGRGKEHWLIPTMSGCLDIIMINQQELMSLMASGNFLQLSKQKFKIRSLWNSIINK